MGASVINVPLSSFVFEGSHPSFYRDRIGPVEERDANYDNRYDFHTLIYDCYFASDAGEVVLICPSLFNFRPLMEAATWQIDGVDVKIKKIEKLSRGNAVRIKAPSDSPKTISFTHPLFSGELDINAEHLDDFAGKNAIYAISKDNNLEWVKDWLTYYVMEHGANAVVIYDNHSTAYSMEDLEAALISVPGIEAACVVRAWFPFGPGGPGNTNFNSKFLHMTMVELGRRRLLGQARAVLNVDIDELVYSTEGQSIFDATVASEQGYVRMNGQWAYAKAPAEGQMLRHADHTHIRSDGRPKCNRKYCVQPLGPLKGRPWLTHRILSQKDKVDPQFGFWHFRRISNNWDYNRETLEEDKLELETRLVATMERVFGAAGTSSKA